MNATYTHICMLYTWRLRAFSKEIYMSPIGVEPVVSTSEAYMSQAGFPNEAIYVSDSARLVLKRRAVQKKKEMKAGLAPSARD